MPAPINGAVRHRVKSFLHENLLKVIDLRRTDYAQLRNSGLRAKVESLVKECLGRMEKGGNLSGDVSLVAEIVDEAIGLGPMEPFLRDPTVTEVMVNGPDRVYVERDGRIELTGARFVNEASLRTAIDRIVTPLGRRVDEASPMVDARLQDGSRVNAIIPPLALNGPTVTIRKFSKTPLSIEKMVRLGSLTKQTAGFLELLVRFRKNILIAGGTGSGKTTLLNAMAAFIPHAERIVTIEDAAELRLAQEHVVSLETRPTNVEGKGRVSVADLTRNALRMRPDRIVVGECRGGEALDMLQAMNTGHDGSLTTAHANSPRDALFRLETMVLMAGYDLPLRAVREQIASALDIIIFMARFSDGGRKITHVTEVCGTESGTILAADLFVRKHAAEPLHATGCMPRFMDSLPPQQREQALKALTAPEIP